MFRWLKAMYYYVTFQFTKAADSLSSNPAVMSANYDSIIADKKNNVKSYKDAIARLISQKTKKEERLASLSESIDKMEKLMAGAKAKASKVAAAHNGDREAAQNDPEFQRCMTAYKDFSSTCAAKREEADTIEEELQGLGETIESHKNGIQTMMREVENIQQEKGEAVADVISATEEAEIADMLSGVSTDSANEELAKLRELRRDAKSRATVSRETAGLDTKNQEADFLEELSTSQANDEFMDDIFGDEKTSEDPAPENESERLPES